MITLSNIRIKDYNKEWKQVHSEQRQTRKWIDAYDARRIARGKQLEAIHDTILFAMNRVGSIKKIRHLMQ